MKHLRKNSDDSAGIFVGFGQGLRAAPLDLMRPYSRKS
jgi:hypothetical protein